MNQFYAGLARTAADSNLGFQRVVPMPMLDEFRFAYGAYTDDDGMALGALTSLRMDVAGGGELFPEGTGEYSVNASRKGLEIIAEHLRNVDADNGFRHLPNWDALSRVTKAFEAGRKLVGGEANFYLHEIYEHHLCGKGIPRAIAHQLTIQKWGVSPFSVYPRETVESFFPEFFNSAWLKVWKGP